MNTIPARASRTQRTTQDDIDEVPDSYYDTRLPTSARRYVDTHGNRVIQQGNRRIVIHEEPPPKKRTHWMLYIGIGMLVMLTIWFGVQMVDTTPGGQYLRLSQDIPG